LGIWLSLDPLEFVNRYSYVFGNPVNITDRSGLCPEKSLCATLIEMGLNEAYRSMGCDSNNACCGYDVTPWFVQELWNHGNYMEQILASSRQIPSFPFPLNIFPENVFDEMSTNLGFREYAAAIPYKWMNFAVNGWNSACPSGWQCTRSVTLCETCIDRSELGNIMFGYAGGKLAFNQDWLWGLARLFGALRGEAERAAAGIGIHLSAHHIGSVDDFCRLVRSAANTFPDGSRWDWSLINSGQEPDVSQCTPCSELLPVSYPHTIPTINNPVAGTRIWADSSVGEGNSDDRFFISQIPGVEYLSPELCPDLYSVDIACRYVSRILKQLHEKD
jgi:hypothetical protein